MRVCRSRDRRNHSAKDSARRTLIPAIAASANRLPHRHGRLHAPPRGDIPSGFFNGDDKSSRAVLLARGRPRPSGKPVATLVREIEAGRPAGLAGLIARVGINERAARAFNRRALNRCIYDLRGRRLASLETTATRCVTTRANGVTSPVDSADRSTIVARP